MDRDNAPGSAARRSDPSHAARESSPAAPAIRASRRRNMTSKRTMARAFSLVAGLALVAGACTSGGGGGGGSGGGAATIPGVPQSLIDAAKGEGNLTTIALPHSWCNYGKMLTDFTSKFGIKINELNPHGGS